MIRRLILLSLMGVSTYANDAQKDNTCLFNGIEETTVTWKAYKTPLKVGVGGKFDRILLSGVKKGSRNIEELLKGTLLKIEEVSVNSGNQGRDEKLVKYFFEKMDGKEILVKVEKFTQNKDIHDGFISTMITMNGVTKSVPLKYHYENGLLEASGVIDVFDFQGESALKSINQACKALHQGKTWSDVDIGFKTKILKQCP